MPKRVNDAPFDGTASIRQTERWLRPLTLRQRDVVMLLMSGDGYKQIAAKLDIAWQTARLHVTRIASGLPGNASPIRKVLEHADALLAFTDLTDAHLRSLVPLPSSEDQRHAARGLLTMAIRRNEIIPGARCVVCDNTERRLRGHHTDYARPYDVVWLCTVCHAQVHERERNPSGRAA
jgi:hypothetical protein